MQLNSQQLEVVIRNITSICRMCVKENVSIYEVDKRGKRIVIKINFPVDTYYLHFLDKKYFSYDCIRRISPHTLVELDFKPSFLKLGVVK